MRESGRARRPPNSPPLGSRACRMRDHRLQSTAAGRRRRSGLLLGLALLLCAGGCARYNTYYNANQAFRQAERQRDDRLKAGQEVAEPTADQKKLYERAIQKSQKILDDYPGHGLTDDALFLMAKSYHRLASYRMSMARFELLFANFPATPFEEEALFYQAINHLQIGDVIGSNAHLERLAANYPSSRFRAEAARVRGENSFSLSDWAAARDAFRDFLARFADAGDADRVGFQLAQCEFQLRDYPAAAERLRAVLTTTERRELAFRARLLLVRVLAHLGEHEAVAPELTRLREEAETYRAEGEVTLAEAENLVLQGQGALAAPLLENMPRQWLSGAVGARAGDLLGRIYLEQWRLDDANTQLREAIKGLPGLEDPEGTRRLHDSLRDYLAAKLALESARPERVPGYKLNQANALLLGLKRPRLALDIYLELAGLADSDSSAAARGLYGAALTYREHLGQPDSASLMLARLQEEFPDSPQAFASRTGGEGDLLGHLLALRERELRDRAARAEAAPPPAPAADVPADGATLQPALAAADTAAAGPLPAPEAAVIPDTTAAPAGAVIPDTTGAPAAAAADTAAAASPGGSRR